MLNLCAQTEMKSGNGPLKLTKEKKPQYSLDWSIKDASWKSAPKQAEWDDDEGKQAGQTSVETCYLWDHCTGLYCSPCQSRHLASGKHTYIQHPSHILTLFIQLKWNSQWCQDIVSYGSHKNSKRLISNASGWNPAGHQSCGSQTRVQRWLYGNEYSHIKFIKHSI